MPALVRRFTRSSSRALPTAQRPTRHVRIQTHACTCDQTWALPIVLTQPGLACSFDCACIHDRQCCMHACTCVHAWVHLCLQVGRQANCQHVQSIHPHAHLGSEHQAPESVQLSMANRSPTHTPGIDALRRGRSLRCNCHICVHAVQHAAQEYGLQSTADATS